MGQLQGLSKKMGITTCILHAIPRCSYYKTTQNKRTGFVLLKDSCTRTIPTPSRDK